MSSYTPTERNASPAASLPSGIQDPDRMLAKQVAAKLIDDTADVSDIDDPRTPEFAVTLLAELVALIEHSPGIMKRALKGASASAKNLTISKLQGIIECLQNADDVRASQVRITVRRMGDKLQLLIVHNGQPVTFHHILPMAMPYVTTKTEDHELLGQFGIGLKTLKRIAENVAVHSAPYHFSGDLERFGMVDSEDALPGLYDPTTDTMLVITLNGEATKEELQSWFDSWDDDGLLFLRSLRSFRWCELDGATRAEHGLQCSSWQSIQVGANGIESMYRRQAWSGERRWTVWRATVTVPKGCQPSNKPHTTRTDISIGIAHHGGNGALHIGFKTTLPATVPFSLNAQFNPDTSRENFIEDPWNQWLVAQSANVLAVVAELLLMQEPALAWSVIPCPGESIGPAGRGWIHRQFAAGFAQVRQVLCEKATMRIDGVEVPLSGICYEDEGLASLISTDDLRAIRKDKVPLPLAARDALRRWYKVAYALDKTFLRVAKNNLLYAFKRNLFHAKPPPWWAAVGRFIVERSDKLGEYPFGEPFLLSSDQRPIACADLTATAIPLLFDATLSGFARHWNLFDHLHPVYGTSEDGKIVLDFLRSHTRFATEVSVELELEAFAKKHQHNPVELTDNQVRELRDRFDLVGSERAKPLGLMVGGVILLEGFVYDNDRPSARWVRPSNAYFCKSLVKDQPYWPVAAGTTPGIEWIASKYEGALRTGTRNLRGRTPDGITSRGLRRFLTLLGVMSSPRIFKLNEPGRPGTYSTRSLQLSELGAHRTEYDYVCDDLKLVLRELAKSSKTDAKLRSPALLKSLAGGWNAYYTRFIEVPAIKVVRNTPKEWGAVTADWLILLRETAWVAVGAGKRVLPDSAVIKSPDTALYKTSECAVGVADKDIPDDMAAALGMVKTVRVSDLVQRLKEMRDGHTEPNSSRAIEFYRMISRQCPAGDGIPTMAGDMLLWQLRAEFSAGDGLILTNRWCRPEQVFLGQDIFHEPGLFVPDPKASANLWRTLSIGRPGLDACISHCRAYSRPLNINDAGMWNDLYRYMETQLEHISRRQKDRMRALPLACGAAWQSTRPVLYIGNKEMHTHLAAKLPRLHFWDPPCDPRTIDRFAEACGVTLVSPEVKVIDDRKTALARGDSGREQFESVVECLSADLARNDPAVREKLRIGWDQLRDIALFLYEQPVTVRCRDDSLGTPVAIHMNALLVEEPLELHVFEEALGSRAAGQAIAQLFPEELRHNIEAHWVAAWDDSKSAAPKRVRLASDDEHKKAMQEQANKINAGRGKGDGKIKIKPRTNQQNPGAQQNPPKPRMLKTRIGIIKGAIVFEGIEPKPAKPAGKVRLHNTSPPPSDPIRTRGSLAGYTNDQLEDHAWQVLEQVLCNGTNDQLIDFRRRHGVGADGGLNSDWKKFVELKAAGRGMQSAIDLRNSEYERARRCGNDYVLALVYGMEEGEKAEVRLIFDPLSHLEARPLNGIRMCGLATAPAVVIEIEDDDEDDHWKKDDADPARA